MDDGRLEQARRETLGVATGHLSAHILTVANNAAAVKSSVGADDTTISKPSTLYNINPIATITLCEDVIRPLSIFWPMMPDWALLVFSTLLRSAQIVLF